MKAISYDNVKSKIIEIRGKKVIIDSDVAELYGVKTKHINQAVKNNPEKFPKGYIIEMNGYDKNEVVKNFDHLEGIKYSNTVSKCFTEKGLYMLATILKSPMAVSTTLCIIETFAKARELADVAKQMAALPENSVKQKALVEHTGKLLTDFITADDALELKNSVTTYEINLAIFRVKKTVKKGK